MNVLRAVYALLLHLYPRPFREAFGSEMRAVYAQSLREKALTGRKALAGFLLRELFDLPLSLMREYWYAIRTRNAGLSPAIQGATGGSVELGSGEKPPRAWEILMAGLPHFLFGLLMSSSQLINAVLGEEAVLNPAVQISQYVGLILIAVIALPLSIWKYRQAWSASWYLVYALLVIFAVNFLFQNAATDPQSFIVSILALAIAFLLYYAARADAIRGLLAGLPFALAAWQPFLESTPRTIIDPFLQGVLSLSSWVMLGLVAALTAQSRRLGLGLILALGVLAASGMGHAVLGTYQGGMLPFSEPGPSLRVAGLYAVRTLLVSAAILLGPQLARCLRFVGQRSGALGRISYRLALLGMVFLLATYLLYSNEIMFGATESFRLPQNASLNSLLYAGIALYHTGYGLLLAAVWRARESRFWFELALLYGLIGAVPVALLLGWPIRLNAPTLSLGQLLPPVLAWLILSVGVAARFQHRVRQRTV